MDKKKKQSATDTCHCYRTFEFFWLLICNIGLLVSVINNIDTNKWAIVILLSYCMVCNGIYWLLNMCKCCMYRTMICILLNQMIALVINLIIASILLSNGLIEGWPDVVISSIIGIAVIEIVLYWFPGCTLFRISGIYELYLWRYYFRHCDIYDPLMKNAPSIQETSLIVAGMRKPCSKDVESTDLIIES